MVNKIVPINNAIANKYFEKVSNELFNEPKVPKRKIYLNGFLDSKMMS